MRDATNSYTGSYQEYLDDMDRDDEDFCPGCGRPADADCHPMCMYQQPCPSE